MADLDTREKRASAWGFLYRPPPQPDGIIDAADRRQLGWVYSGIELVEPEPVIQRQTVTAADILDGRVRQRAETVRWDLLDVNLQKIGELHPVKTPASIDANTESTYARALRNLALIPSEAAEIDTFASRIKPWWVLETGDEYPMGVFMFQGRDRQLRTWGGLTVFQQLMDQTFILAQGRRSTYGVTAGTLASDHLRTLAAEAGITDLTGIENSSITVAAPRAWPTGTTRYEMMRQLCELLAFYPPYFDNDGKLICRSVPNLDLATPDHVYRLGDESRIVADSGTESDDAWTSYNVFPVVDTAAGATPIEATYEIPSDAPNSVLHRGFEVVAPPIAAPGVASVEQAEAIGKAAYAQSPGAYRWVEFDATPDPRHDLFAIVEFDGVNYREPAWNLTCAPGGPHHHSLRRVWSDN